ncbi:MAG: sulfotransferase family protein [Roseivirga sp.]|nr:sulfotransferase family protein [Roseivirga sp.]
MTAFHKALSLIKREFSYFRIKPGRLIFDHISKCAGTSVYYFLKPYYPYRKTYSINGSSPEKSVQNFARLAEKKQQSYLLIHGHLARGLFSLVPENTLYITTLRDPIDRIASHYEYVKRDKTNHLHRKVVEGNIFLTDYCARHLSPELENWYVSYFSGLTKDEMYADPGQAIEIAYSHLIKDYQLIGFQDRIPDFLNKVAELAGLPNAKADKHHKNKTIRHDGGSLSDEERDSISSYNKLDIALYEKLMLLRKNGTILNI